MNRFLPLILFVLLSAIIIIQSCNTKIDNNSTEEELTGEELSLMYCASCHTYPSPAVLNYDTWKNTVLVRMSAYLGIFNDNQRYYDVIPERWIEPGIGGEMVKAANIYPTKPLISRGEWEKIRNFYLQNAPKDLLISELNIVSDKPFGFAVRPLLKNSHVHPHVTAIKMKGSRIYAAIYQSKILALNKKGEIIDSLDRGGMVVDINFSKEGFTMTDIGSRHGMDIPIGKLFLSSDMHTAKKEAYTLTWDSLQRPVHVNYADLDNDGNVEIILGIFYDT